MCTFPNMYTLLISFELSIVASWKITLIFRWKCPIFVAMNSIIAQDDPMIFMGFSMIIP